MDISELVPSDTFSLQLEHPVKGKLDIFIEIYGPDSEHCRKLKWMATNERLKNGSKDTPTAEELFEEGNQMLVDRIKSVKGMEYHGEKITPSNMIKVLEDPAMAWIRDQIDHATVNRKLFFSNA